MTTLNELKMISTLERVEAQNERIERRVSELERRVKLIESTIIQEKLEKLDSALDALKTIRERGRLDAALLDLKKLAHSCKGGFWEVK